MRKVAVFLFLSLFSFTACTQMPPVSQQKTSFEAENNPNLPGDEGIAGDRIRLSLEDHIKIDAVIRIPESLQSLEMNLVKASRPIIKQSVAQALFAEDMKVKKVEMDKGYKSRELGGYDIALLYGQQGEFMEVSPTDVYFCIPEIDDYLNCLFTDPDFDSYNLSRFSLTKELPFASREECFQKVKKYFGALGIEISDEYQAYALHHEKLKKEEKPLDMDGNIVEENRKESWTKEDDAYYFILQQEAEGVPIRQLSYGDGYLGTGIEQTELSAIYGKRGWITFREYWGYVLKRTEKKRKIISLEQAVESLKKKYSMLYTEDEILFDAVYLELLPVFIKDNEYEIHPIWRFHGKIEIEHMGSSDMDVCFDGFNGQEIVGS